MDKVLEFCKTYFQDPSVFLNYGIGTFAVLILSWAALVLPFDYCDRHDLLQTYRIQKKPEDF